MAQIREYSAETSFDSPQIVRRASEADTGGVGNSIAELGRRVSRVGKEMYEREAQAEITSITAKMAAAHADMAIDLDKVAMNGDPNDLEMHQKFMTRYDEKLSTLENEVSTREAQSYFVKANAAMRSQFAIQSIRTQASMAGEASVQGYNGSMQNWSALLAREPQSFEATLANHEEMVNALSVDQNKKDKLLSEGETKLAKAQFDGYLNIDPNAAKHLLKSGQWDEYFNASQLMELGREANTYANAQQTESDRLDRAQEKVFKQLNETTKDAMLQKFYSDVPGEGLSTKDILSSKGLSESDKEHFLAMIDKSNKADKIRTDPDTMINLFQRIHAPDGDPQKISDPDVLTSYFGKGLDIPSIQTLRAEIAGKKTPQGEIAAQLKTAFLTTAKDALTKTNPMIGLKDADGDANYQAFLSKFLPAFDSAQRNGKKAENLLDPTSPDYMGKMLDVYRKTPEQVMRSMFSRPSATPSPSLDEAVPAPAATPREGAPKAGEVRKGYRFKGGNPTDRNAWEKVN